MLFSNQKKNDPQTEKKSGSWLNFMFNPEFGNDIRPMGESIRMFVELIALLFAANGLFPKNHPSLLRTEGAPKLTLKMILAIARSQLDFTSREGLPKIILYYAVCGTLFFSAVIAVILILMLFIGTANAADATSACSGTGIFDPCSDKDLSIQWLDYLFQGKAITDSSGVPYPQTTTLQKVLTKVLGFYSTAILVLAGVILLYHLLRMIVDTAATGKVMGGANQVWGPIRLVLAIGLLVPISGGLNVSQAIAIQIAKWGAGLGSQVWNFFVTELGNQTQTVIAPNQPPMVYNLVKNVALMKSCAQIMTYEANILGLPTYTVNYNAAKGTFSSTKDGAICGKVVFPTAPTSADKKRIVDSLYQINKDTFNSHLINNAALDAIAEKSLHYVDPVKYPTPPTKSELTDVVNAYWTVLTGKMNSADFASKTNSAIKDVLEKSNIDGWVSAGAWLNTISRLQSFVLDANQDALPQTSPPSRSYLEKKIMESDNSIYQGAIMDWTGEGSDLATTSHNILKKQTHATLLMAITKLETALAQGNKAYNSDEVKTAASAGAFPESDSGAPITSLLFKAIDYLGGFFGVWPEDGTLIFSLKTANPFAELSRMGHNHLSLGINLILLASLGPLAVTALTAMAGAAGVGASTAGVGAIAGAGLGALVGGVLSQLWGISLLLGGIFATTGATLTFFLPMVPFIRFFFNIITWLVMIFEAVVSMPLFALAHLEPYGEGLHGKNALKGYHNFFHILIRPAMLVIGLMAGLLVFFVAITFLNRIFLIAAAGTGSSGGFATMSKIAYSVMYVAFAYVCANTSFKTIGHFANHTMSWMNASGPSPKDMGHESVFDKIVGPVGGYLAGSVLTEQAKAAGATANKALGASLDKHAALKDKDKKDALLVSDHKRQGNLPMTAQNKKDYVEDNNINKEKYENNEFIPAEKLYADNITDDQLIEIQTYLENGDHESATKAAERISQQHGALGKNANILKDNVGTFDHQKVAKILVNRQTASRNAARNNQGAQNPPPPNDQGTA